jgi:DNA-binding NarL/FixJ family response regulator
MRAIDAHGLCAMTISHTKEPPRVSLARTSQWGLAMQPASAGSSDGEASDAWLEVFSGRYRIVEWYDLEGRRYVVAERNATRAHALTRRQERVLALRAAGAALKVIAADLGVSLSTAGRDLREAMARIGLGSDADLAAVFGHGEG